MAATDAADAGAAVAVVLPSSLLPPPPLLPVLLQLPSPDTAAAPLAAMMRLRHAAGSLVRR